MTDIGIIVSGQAGQGVQVIAQALGRVFVRAGLHAFVSLDVMSRIRGGHNFGRVRVADRPVKADRDTAHLLLALDKGLVEPHVAELEPEAVLIVEDEDGTCAPAGYRAVCIPLLKLAREHGTDVMQNSVALGAALAVLGQDIEPLKAVLAGTFAGKGEEVVRRNVACAEAGHRFAAARAEARVALPGKRDPGPRLFLTGAQALGLGAIGAGVRFVAGYPMSPATPILEYCAAHAQDAGIAVELVEDEIAAVNAIQGATFAGARAMCCTAGGGFSLMCEGLSLAGMTEMPVVIMVGMRPGPATGLATRTAQADLLFAISAGHGEFARAVLAPADAQQAFTAGQRAFAIAERHRTPVIVLFDQFVADASWTVQEPGDGAAGTAEPAGPRPGTAGRLVYLDSDEHTAEGHITESARVRVEQSDRRLGKMKSIARELLPPECSHADAATLVFCFGSTRGVVAEAVSRLRARARSVGMVHLCDVWPFPTETVRGLAGGKRLLTVENNYTGQLARLIRQETLLEVAASVRRFDGRQFRVAEVEDGIEERLG